MKMITINSVVSGGPRSLFFASFLFFSHASFAMVELGDEKLSQVTGQALLQMGKAEESGYTFYKAGLEAELQLNMNIEKLQLGCTATAVNGQFCDIDIDNFSLSGQTWDAERPESSAILTRPFFEFAIDNDDQKTLREVVGIRMSAESVKGMLTAGTENSNTPNGINSISGYMEVAGISCDASSAANNPGSCAGVANVAPRNMNKSHTGKDLTGRVDIGFGFFDVTEEYASNDYQIDLAATTAPFSTDTAVVNGRRRTSVNVTGVAYIQPIDINGSMTAEVEFGGFIPLDLQKEITGVISGLRANMSLSENLGYIHKINVNSPFSLSFQARDVLWPDSPAVAQKGWWMAFKDPVDIGSLTPSETIGITDQNLTDAMGPEGCSNGSTPGINCALYATPVECGAFDCLFGDALDVGTVNVSSTAIPFPLQSLKLQGQDFTPNCYGSAKFC
ncbi:hypothetical protein F1529_13130 [Alcanivorax sp. VBW004]|uniref:hypothetical protein n=1 Tax=Alcanivorax sp. VBW004 TaxID=1287708 RepID=UPI0012BD20EA|nr:hypothetical protein [Alcanivorax sp. VBW004]MTT53425.1 hypothetical protein [Alcanivorax sp. VBW004]